MRIRNLLGGGCFSEDPKALWGGAVSCTEGTAVAPAAAEKEMCMQLSAQKRENATLLKRA